MDWVQCWSNLGFSLTTSLEQQAREHTNTQEVCESHRP